MWATAEKPGGARSRSPRRLSRVVPATLAVVALAAGCSGGSSGSASGESTSSSPVTAAPVADDRSGPTTTAAPAPTTSTSTTTTAPPPPIPAEDLPEPPGPLQAGSVGTRTRAIQQAFRDQRYDAGEPDGRFGAKTTMAVWAFQALWGLPKDGIVTPELEAAILARPAQPMLRPELGPTHTEVDLTRQVMIVWRDGAPSLITHVSSGSEVAYCEETRDGRNCGDAVTPLGGYRFNRRIEGWRDAPLGRLYNPVYFNGGIAVHGAGSVPDRPASHGCVRIPMHIAEYFPTLVANGDHIEVFRS